MEDVENAAKLAEKETKDAPTNGNGPELLDYLVSSGDEDEKEIKFTSTEEQIAQAAAKIQAKRKDMVNVNHSFVQYEPFNKQFFIEPPELKNMTLKEVDDRRMALGGIKVRGRSCPKPIEKWAHFGLPPSVLEVIRKVLRYDTPTGIQAQAIPGVMSGRDVIGIAKTGSGKV
jgi:ATP-dependent RNA helicase DDX46/PRP5